MVWYGSRGRVGRVRWLGSREAEDYLKFEE